MPTVGCHFGKDGKKTIPDVIRHLYANFGASCGQIFIGSPQSPSMSDSLVAKWMKEADIIKQVRMECGGFKIYVHAPYTLNFCMQANGVNSKGESNKDEYWIHAMMVRLRIAHAMGAEGVILHMGKAVKLKVEEAETVFYENICKVVKGIRDEKLKTKIILETSAGQGTELYTTRNNSLDPLVRFWGRFSSSDKKHIGICVDTCHIYAGGYDIGSKEANAKFWNEWGEKLGFECLAVIHMNNSIKGCGSNVDRHAPLAGGSIGLRGLSDFAKIANARHIPMVIETPLCQYDIEILTDFINKTPDELSKQTWGEEWFKERHLANVFAELGF